MTPALAALRPCPFCGELPTPSGPRLVIARFNERIGVVFKASMADLACDECDTPWMKTANGEGAGE